MSSSQRNPKARNAPKARSSRANPRKRKASSKSKSVKASVAASRNRSTPSKQDAILVLLQRPKGATLPEITEATGWQPHSVRGFLSGVVKKKLKLKVESRKDGRDRTYRIKGRTSS
ncbi:DUF3489 domain-containing protein [Nitrobacter sp. TKz-YC02]|uniref:DUF3489 domain-containing protein n=1 Tax=Nitrobacter sp. TKz-YC02 TaxID=3398704 RepID=UPI003CEF4125